ncbi:putative two-component histidine kinase [Flavihumibacter petaseus NBRC 106054]|uniref:histidine kinase n=1 Tax=Flavihumibacter petaseus NBRC 106054 TaxID=1220578 RepID=A0A0E9N4H2_9BACT|nr:putative two-component histidine kinase [Flavihumibacter petaseus NBRC 106054]
MIFLVSTSAAAQGTGTLSFKANRNKLDKDFDAGNIREMEKLYGSSSDSLKADVARYISRYYNDGNLVPRNFKKAKEYALVTLEISTALGDLNRQINANNQVAYVLMVENLVDEAEPYLVQVTRLGAKPGAANVGFAYNHLLIKLLNRGHYNRATQYGMDALRYLESAGGDEYAIDIYNLLGTLYKLLGNNEKCYQFYTRAADEAEKRAGDDAENFWFNYHYKIIAMMKLGMAAEASTEIKTALRRYPPPTPFALTTATIAQARVYAGLKDYALAEETFLKALELTSHHERYQTPYQTTINRNLADLYIDRGNWTSARTFINRVLETNAHLTTQGIADAHLVAFRADSALGDFRSAMLHLQKSKTINDSLNAVSKLRQAEELQLQYETEKMTQDVKLKQQTILLLQNSQALQSREYEENRLQFLLDNKNKENELLTLNAAAAVKDKNLLLSQQNITQLKTDIDNRKARLEEANFTRNITFVFVGLLALIAVLLFWQYRSKQAATRIIGKKNEVLEGLVREKEGLLEEKDWLLKEVHHRVKNNLQTVVSLLESQSVYLDEKALQANQDSRNRVYAMSLVHQKLYQSENIASIQMDTYLSELVIHLRDSMGDGHILFRLQLQPVKLDVSQAIPIGLILNEAITNAIKYAFPVKASGQAITIGMQLQPSGELCLTVQDNGIGLPPGVESGNPAGLGMRLMKGLTGDIMGNFDLRSDHGTTVTVSFLPVETLRNSDISPIS